MIFIEKNNYKSWGGLKKQLESLLCDSLKDRISYFYTTYRKAHDHYGRASINLDKNEILNCEWTVMAKQWYDICEQEAKMPPHGGADVVLEVAGAENTFELAWQCARPNAIVTVVALYDKAQALPLPDMYGKNLTFKTGGVDGCDCEETLKLIAEGKLDTEPLITHTYPLAKIDEAYELFENKRDGVIKVAVEC